MRWSLERGGNGANVSQVEVVIGGRRLRTTPVFETYWRFAAERQAMYEARLRGETGPWTSDPILREHRFTNCFRAADRVSQYLIGSVIYRGDQTAAEVVFRTLLFKLFNKVTTWELLCDAVGDPSWSSSDLEEYDRVLGKAFENGQRLYSAAYVMPPPKLGAARKYTNHLLLLRMMMKDGLPYRLAQAPSMAAAFDVLRSYPSIGDFLAFQFLIDLNYSPVLNFDEMDFVVAGPGARDGIRKCFGAGAAGIEAEIIRYMADTQHEHFERLSLTFGRLSGRRSLQLIDCQNLFCEVDKYARVAHPQVRGISGRSRIKQRFTPVGQPLTAWFPPKWGLNASSEGRTETAPSAESTRELALAVG
jgi:hypothetical protein